MRTIRWMAAGAGLLLCVANGAASAHDVWLTTTGDAEARRVLVNYGHPNDRPPAFAEKIIEIDAISSGGKTSLLKGLASIQDNGISVVTTTEVKNAGALLITARYDNGFWTTGADGEVRNVTKRSVPNAKDSLWSGKFAKLVTGAGAPWQTVAGHDLELVPLSDPAEAKPGDMLKVRVLFQGKPLPRARVARADGVTHLAEDRIPRFTAGSDGVAEVKIEKAGPQLLVVERAQKPSATPDQASTDLYNATFWFSVN